MRVFVCACVRACVCMGSSSIMKWTSPRCCGEMEISNFGNVRCSHHRAGRSCFFSPLYDIRVDCGLRGRGSPHRSDASYAASDAQSAMHALGAAMITSGCYSPEQRLWFEKLAEGISASFKKRTVSLMVNINVQVRDGHCSVEVSVLYSETIRL